METVKNVITHTLYKYIYIYIFFYKIRVMNIIYFSEYSCVVALYWEFRVMVDEGVHRNKLKFAPLPRVLPPLLAASVCLRMALSPTTLLT